MMEFIGQAIVVGLCVSVVLVALEPLISWMDGGSDNE